MSVRKRSWTTRLGEKKEAWIVDYFEQDGDRHIETFKLKREVEQRHDEVRIDVRKGTHTAASKSITVEVAAEAWIKRVEANGMRLSARGQRSNRPCLTGHVRRSSTDRPIGSLLTSGRRRLKSLDVNGHRGH